MQAIVKCQDLGNDSGVVIIDLPPNVLTAMNVDLGDYLSIELVDGSIVLNPLSDTDTQSRGRYRPKAAPQECQNPAYCRPKNELPISVSIQLTDDGVAEGTG